MALFLEAVLITVQYYVFFLQLYLWRKSIPLAAKYQLLFFFFNGRGSSPQIFYFCSSSIIIHNIQNRKIIPSINPRDNRL